MPTDNKNENQTDDETFILPPHPPVLPAPGGAADIPRPCGRCRDGGCTAVCTGVYLRDERSTDRRRGMVHGGSQRDGRTPSS